MPIWIKIPVPSSGTGSPKGSASGSVPPTLDPDFEIDDDFDLDLIDEEPECTCAMTTLICKGCQCGAMQKERDGASGSQSTD